MVASKSAFYPVVLDKTVRKFPCVKLETPEAKRSLKVLGKVLMEAMIKKKKKNRYQVSREKIGNQLNKQM